VDGLTSYGSAVAYDDDDARPLLTLMKKVVAAWIAWETLMAIIMYDPLANFLFPCHNN
jgi:hypothetical protein